MKKDIFLGRRVAVYRIDKFLGEGGFAYVYKARDTNLEIDVALKVLKPAFAYDEVFEANFRREAHRAAKFRHPNVIAIHYAGKDDDIVYFSMDLLDAGLKDLMRGNQPLDDDVILKVGLDVASALMFAHTFEGGIVHRDLKPDNILFDRHGNAVVTDFGIAEAATNYTTATGTTIYVGTPKYMSPEQARGQRVDHRSDIYSLGVTLYEMATGEAPFVGRDWFELGRKHIEELPVLPREKNPDLSAELERIVLKCLQKVPADRYQSSDHLRQDLASLVGGGAVVVNLPPPEPAVAARGPAAAAPPAAAPVGAAAAPPRREPSIHEATTVPPKKKPRVWPWLAFAALLAGVLAAYTYDVQDIRTLGEERFPVLAQIPYVGTGTTYATGFSYAPIEGGADVESPEFEIFFSGPVDPVTASRENVKLLGPQGRQIPAEIAVRDDRRRLLLTAAEQLDYETQYTVAIGPGLLSAKGTPIFQNSRDTQPGAEFAFATRLAPPDTEPPALAGSTPAKGAQGVAVDVPITLSFSEPMDSATLNPESIVLQDGQGARLDILVYMEDNRSFSIEPTPSLSHSANYALIVTPGVTDRSGNPIAADTVLFSTAAAPKPVPPRPARLTVNVVPPEATYRTKLLMDGREVGYLPIINMQVEPNRRHTLQLVGTDMNSSYTVALHTRQIMLEPGQHFEIRQDIQPFGSVTVASQPYADVFIDGNKVGSTPLAGYVLFVGTHTLELHPTYENERNYQILRREFQVLPFQEISLGNLALPPK